MEDALDCYAGALGCTRQQATNQLRNAAGLNSVLARPQNYALYQDADLALQAAVLAHGIAEGQHFIEGNKRTAWIALQTFLLENGYEVPSTEEQRAVWILELSEGKTASEFAEQLRARLVEVD
jgi:death-on-curing protein